MNWNTIRNEINALATEHRGIKAQASRALKITPAQVTQYLSGQVRPSLFRVKRFAEFLSLIKQEIEEQEQELGSVVLDRRVNPIKEEERKSKAYLDQVQANVDARYDKTNFMFKSHGKAR